MAKRKVAKTKISKKQKKNHAKTVLPFALAVGILSVVGMLLLHTTTALSQSQSADITITP
jgi:hypothetical protein